MDVGALVKCEPDVGDAVVGRIEALDADEGAEILVELDNWRIVVVLQVLRDERRE